MKHANHLKSHKNAVQSKDDRSLLLADLPVTERRLELAGISTAVLVGGEGPPIILLHGPGESCVWWRRVIPELVETHRVIVPDLPGHGSSGVIDGPLEEDIVLSWLGALVDQTCSESPVMVGHLLGGSIAARFAIHRGEQLSHLILVNSFGLVKFRPAPVFAFELMRFMIWPTEKNYNRFLPQCLYDIDELRLKMGRYWKPFMAYNLQMARNADSKKALQELMKNVGIPKIPDEQLEQIPVPTGLIWGRYDRANKLRKAEAAGERLNWPLRVIEETRDDPKLERPEAFVQAVYDTLGYSTWQGESFQTNHQQATHR